MLDELFSSGNDWRPARRRHHHGSTRKIVYDPRSADPREAKQALL